MRMCGLPWGLTLRAGAGRGPRAGPGGARWGVRRGRGVAWAELGGAMLSLPRAQVQSAGWGTKIPQAMWCGQKENFPFQHQGTWETKLII